MTAVINIIQNTPVWVFPLIAGVLWLGSLNLRQRMLQIRLLFAFPLVMLVLSVGNSIGTSAPPALALADWIGCAAVGAAIGWSLARRPLAIDSAARRITLSGSMIPLVVSMAILVLRYTFGYLYARYPELVADPLYALALIAGGAILGGVTFGRYGRLALWYRRAVNPLAEAGAIRRG
jgi:hypothetical protein